MPRGPAHEHFIAKVASDLVLLPEDAFGHFVRNATVVEPHVRINNETGTAEGTGLFYTANLPPESVLIAPVFASMERRSERQNGGDRLSAEQVMALLVRGRSDLNGLDGALVQVGGDATTGRGHVVVNFA